MLHLQEELLTVEEDRLHDSEGNSVSEVATKMREMIQEVAVMANE